MSRYSVGLIIAFLLAGCAQKGTLPYDRQKENDFLFEAVFLENSGAYEHAALFYEKLYRLTHAREYLLRSIRDYIKAKDFKSALRLLQKNPKDYSYYALSARLHFAMKDLEKAKEEMLKALAFKKSAADYEFLASIYLMQKEYEKALKYYKSAYALDPKPHTVDSIAYIMYFYLDRPTEAIAYLETHTRIYGCDKRVCQTLASLYGLRNDINGLISVYKRLYERYKEEQYAKKLAELYIYNKEYDKAEKYAKEIGDKELLLELYKAQKKFHKAQMLAQELYEQTKEPKYLAQSAMFEYEGSKSKERKLLLDVASKLERAIKKDPDPLFLNYLGYLYIDHDLDVRRGIELVKRALAKEPNSPYYLDSLAWGYYKLGRCGEALKLEKRVYYELGFKDSEVQYHLQMIERCAKEKH